MPIPEFNDVKAPALRLFLDGKARPLSEVVDVMGKHFALTPEELAELLPSGTERRLHNRVSWGCYDLYRAGLLERPKRGVYLITELGRTIAAQKPKIIDRDFLLQFPSFAEFTLKSGTRRRPGAPTGGKLGSTTEFERTPEELIDSAYQVLHSALKKELLDLVKKMDPFKFEQVVLDLLLAMGYGGSREEAAQVTKASGDEGIDGVINEDRLGLDVIYLQAKRWQQTVGRKEIQSFVGALAGQQAHKGVFITTSDFADTATAYAKKVPQKVILIDGDRLADLMIQNGIGVSKSHSYDVKHIDGDYFENS
jgi:restriction system protein